MELMISSVRRKDNMKLLGKKIYRVGLKPYKNGLGAHNRNPDGSYKTSSSGCCVHPDTRISMADGTTKAAKDIRIGDELMTQAGTGKVEVITNPELGYRSLYSYGRGSYFITGDHPIHADGEWKSLMPGFSKLDYGVECTRLEKGAVLTLINGDKVKLEKIEGETNNPNLVLYDFHMDGDTDANHTYFANGLLVHNGGGGGGGGGGGCRSRSSSAPEGQGHYDDTGAYHYGTDYAAGGQYHHSTIDTGTEGSGQGLMGSPEAVQAQQDQADAIDESSINTETGEYVGTKPEDRPMGEGILEGIAQNEAETTPSEVTNPEAGVTGETPSEQVDQAQDDSNYDSFQEEIQQAEIDSQYDPVQPGAGYEVPTQEMMDMPGFDDGDDGPSGLHPSQVQAGVPHAEDRVKQNFLDAQQQQDPQLAQKPLTPEEMGDPDFKPAWTDEMQAGTQQALDQQASDEYDDAAQEYEDEVIKREEEGFLANYEQTQNEEADQNYVDDLKDMWDNFEERPQMTPAEVQRLKDEGYIKGEDLPDVAQGGGAPHPANLDTSTQVYADTSDVADTQSKIEAGAENLGQIDYQNIATWDETDQINAYHKLNPNATLDGALDFSNLTGTSPTNYMTVANYEQMEQTGQGYANLSLEHKASLIHEGKLEFSDEALEQLSQDDLDFYFNSKNPVHGVPVPKMIETTDKDGNPITIPEDYEAYRNYNRIRNALLDAKLDGDVGANVDAMAMIMAQRGKNWGKQAIHKLTQMKLSSVFNEAQMTLLAPMLGMHPLAGFTASKVIGLALKHPKKEIRQAARDGLIKQGVVPEMVYDMEDAKADLLSRPEYQQKQDDWEKEPEFQQKLRDNWNLENGFTSDPNAIGVNEGLTGQYTPTYGYDKHGIPQTKEDAIERNGIDWVLEREQRYKDTNTPYLRTDVSGDPLEGDLGTGFEDLPSDHPNHPDNNQSGDPEAPAAGSPDSGGGGDDKPPKEILDKGGDVPAPTPTTGGGTRDERWERFMDLMEKRATGEAPSLSEAAMRKEREEGLKERMAMMAMGRGQPTAAGLRTYDRAKGAADAELARDSAIARLREQQSAQDQYGKFLTEKLGQESRERIGALAPNAQLKMKQMTLDSLKTEADRKMWLDIAKNTWKIFGDDIEDWIKEGWGKDAAKQAIESQGGTVSEEDWDKYSSIPSFGGGDAAAPDIISGDKDADYVSKKADLRDDADEGNYVFNEDLNQWEWKYYWEEYHEGGRVEGPGTETSDDIPALLSDGEFVIKASAVKGLGRSKGAKNDKEARKKGIDLLYKLQEKYGDMEEHGDGGAAFGDVLAARRRL